MNNSRNDCQRISEAVDARQFNNSPVIVNVRITGDCRTAR